MPLNLPFPITGEALIVGLCGHEGHCAKAFAHKKAAARRRPLKSSNQVKYQKSY